MEEIVEQYKNAKKWRKEMFITMIVMLLLMAVIIIVGIIITDLMALFFIFGAIMGLLGAVIYAVAHFTFKKADGLVREYLANLGKSEEEIRSILGDEKSDGK